MSIGEKIITIAENVQKVYNAGYNAGQQAGGGGGGSLDDIYYVTFMNGDTHLLTRPVYFKDDCPDPVNQDRFEEPTKESTTMTVYTYNGWSLTDGGGADASALKSVTENRTVYAAYTEGVRYYTVRFFDGETLLKSEQIAYGGSSSYTHKKDNHLFMGWNPEPVNITSDLDCYGVWEESYSFADASWEYISRISQMGKASEVFALGDTRTETLTYSDGTTEDVELMIASFDLHPDTNGKPTITLINNNLLYKAGLVNFSEYTSVVGNRMSYSNTTNGDVLLKSFMDNTVIPAFSIELQGALREVDVGNTLHPFIVKIAPPTYLNVGLDVDGKGKVSQNTLYSFTADDSSRVRSLPDGLPDNFYGYGYWLYDYPYNRTASTLSAGSVNAEKGEFNFRFYNNSNLVMFKVFI